MYTVYDSNILFPGNKWKLFYLYSAEATIIHENPNEWQSLTLEPSLPGAPSGPFSPMSPCGDKELNESLSCDKKICVKLILK